MGAKVEKAALGCFSCLALVAGLIGLALGGGLGFGYALFFAEEGARLWPVLGGAGLGALAGVRVVVPIEELFIDWTTEKLFGKQQDIA